MINRRQWIGSVAALNAAVLLGPVDTLLARTASAADRNNRPLNWRCDVVNTIPHTKSRRRPVVTGVDMRPAGDLIALVGDDHYVCLYDMNRREFVSHTHQHTDWVRAAKFSPDGQRLATAGNDRQLIVNDVAQMDDPVFIKRQQQAIIDLAFSSDGKTIATVGFDRKLRLFDAADGTKINEADCHCADNHCVAFSPDDSVIAVGSRSGEIHLWNAATFEELSHFKHHRQRIRGMRYTPEGKLLSVGDDQVVCLTDPQHADDAVKLKRQSAKLYAAQAIGDDFFATAGSDNRIHIWNADDMTGVGVLSGHTGTVSCLASQGSKLISGSYDTTIRIWTTDLDSYVRNVATPKDRQTRMTDGWSGSPGDEHLH